MAAVKDETRAWLRLLALPGIGPIRGRALLERYGTPDAILGSDEPLVKKGLARLARTPWVEDRLDRSLRTMDRDGVRLLPITSETYPEGVRHLHDPPLLLFAQGDLGLLGRPAVAVVGTRGHTEYGAETARTVAGGLGPGVVVVSGLARGIDAVAHAAALETGTIAVLGNGIDVVYPKENRRLQAAIAARGLLVSEFLPGEPPLGGHFTQRNRIIAALSVGVVVVEAPHRSGALSTVRHATDLGREVMAVPGPVNRRASEGTNALIRDGARLVMSAADILQELHMTAPEERPHDPPDLDGAGRSIWAALADEPRSVDAIAAATRLTPARVLTILTRLELGGRVRQLPGGRFRRPG